MSKQHVMRLKREDVVELRRSIKVKTIMPYLIEKTKLAPAVITERVFDELVFVVGLKIVIKEAEEFLLKKRRDGLQNMNIETSVEFTKNALAQSLRDKGFADVAAMLEGETDLEKIVALMPESKVDDKVLN